MVDYLADTSGTIKTGIGIMTGVAVANLTLKELGKIGSKKRNKKKQIWD